MKKSTTEELVRKYGSGAASVTIGKEAKGDWKFGMCYLGRRLVMNGKIVDATMVFKLYRDIDDPCPFPEYFVEISSDFKNAKISLKI